MEPTFVFGWPSRQEQGDFLTLDLGAFEATGYALNLINILFSQAEPISEYVWSPCRGKANSRSHKASTN
jgi:hypothetical protein